MSGFEESPANTPQNQRCLGRPRVIRNFITCAWGGMRCHDTGGRFFTSVKKVSGASSSLWLFQVSNACAAQNCMVAKHFGPLRKTEFVPLTFKHPLTESSDYIAIVAFLKGDHRHIIFSCDEMRVLGLLLQLDTSACD